MSPSDIATDNERVLNWVHENKNGGDSSEIGLASSLYKACLCTLGLLSKQYVTSRKPSRSRKARLVESHARLCLFGDELLHEGALEHCLKVDDDLREQILGLLYCLGKTLLRGAETLYHAYGPEQTKEELVSGLADLVESTSLVLSQQGEPGDDVQSDSDNSEVEDSEIEDEITALNEDDDVLSALYTYTTSLMDLRPVLEQALSDISKPPARRAGVSPPEFHVTELARPHVLQVHDKFRDAKSALVERLGEANWQRYIRLKTMAAAVGEAHPEVTVPEVVFSEVPKSAFRPISQFHDSGLGTSVPSRSHYAASNTSHTSFLSTETDAAKGKLRVPSTPMEVGEGKAFTCSICTHRLSGIKNRVEWKIHVFADLHPYICTFPDCPDLLTTYPTRRLWAEHEFKTHRSHQQYECYDCSQIFSNDNKFIDHMKADHQYTNLSHTQLLATVSAAKKSVFYPLGDQACPLCHKTGWAVQRDFVTHLGRHLEEIALSSLPRHADSDTESGSDTDTDAGGATSSKAPSRPESLAASHAVGYKGRCKVYEVRSNDWFERGTGSCSLQTIDDNPSIIVESEDQPDKLLLQTRILKDNGFRKQQDNLIVWTEPDGIDFALSFQNSAGCFWIWDYITHFLSQAFNKGEEDHLVSGPNFPDYQPPPPVEWFGDATQQPQSTTSTPAEVEASDLLADIVTGNKTQDDTFNTIKCICPYAKDDGNTVLCEKCDTWQHIDCYYHGQKVPNQHFCTDCRPREVDLKGVLERNGPGPIPSSTPLVVRQDGNGVQWISFEYSRDRVKMEYTIRCDVESVNTDDLNQEFKSENCVYPRACVPKEQYQGNRLNYETECNQVGWSLAELNPCLRSKRGLIQKAVDSWRSSNQDPRLRSRRVRRLAKLNTTRATKTDSGRETDPGMEIPQA